MIRDYNNFIYQIHESIFKRSHDFQNEHNNDYKLVLRCLLQDYLHFIVSQGVKKGSQKYVDIATIVRKLKTITDSYLSGKRSTAYIQLKHLITILHNEGIIHEHKSDVFLYRMRVCEKRRDVKRKDLFHIPFSLIRDISTQRYSTPGYPCLYLAKSIYGCWEEMHRPPIESTLVSLYKSRQNISLLDMRIPDENRLMQYEEFYLRFLPLIIACTIPVQNGKDVFKPEYIFPQMILEWVIEKGFTRNILGIIYTSAFKSNEFFTLDNEWDNIVLPVRMTSSESGYCNKLVNLFEITKPTCYEYEVMLGKMQNTGAWDNGPKRLDNGDNIKLDYYWSTFSRMEEELETRERNIIYRDF